MPTGATQTLREGYQRAIRAAVAKEHKANGTAQPHPKTIEVVTALPAMATIRLIGQDLKTDRHIGMTNGKPSPESLTSLIAQQEHWHRWKAAATASEKAIPTQVTRMIGKADGRIVEVGSGWLSRYGGQPTPEGDTAVMRYHVMVETTGHALKPQSTAWEFSHDLVTDIWDHDHQPSRIATIAANARRAMRGETVTVCAMLAEWMQAQPDRNAVAKLLFGAAHGGKGTRVPWRSLTNLEARNGRIIGTIAFGSFYDEGARMRDGELFLKGKSLPETLCTAAVGRQVSAIVDHPQFGHHIVTKVANVGKDLVITTKTKPVAYASLWEEMNQ